MLVQDTKASVAVLTTAKEDKQAVRRTRKLEKARLDVLQARMRVRLAAEVLRMLEGAHEGESDRPRQRSSSSEREIRSARADLKRERKRLVLTEARARTVEDESHAQDAKLVEKRTYRLQSSRHRVEWTETKYTERSLAQTREPVLVTTTGGWHWWWYRDRFWWDDERLRSDELKTLVLERDFEHLLRRRSTESALAAVWQLPAEDPSAPEISDKTKREVWRRDEGCCVDCGSVQASVFCLIRPIEEGGFYTSRNIELRCPSCDARRRDNEARARVNRAESAARRGEYPGDPSLAARNRGRGSTRRRPRRRR
jgi:hypothetical protein